MDEGDFIETEEGYRIHTAVHLDHKIVAEQLNVPSIKLDFGPGLSQFLETKSE